MGSQTMSILSEGIWASLTGGWYYDKKQSHFTNLFHLYIWLILLALPFVNYLFFNTLTAWVVYCLIIGLIFTIIKGGNAYFHLLFDTAKCIEVKIGSDSSAEEDGDKSEDGERAKKDEFEMTTLQSHSRVSEPNNPASNTYESIRDDDGDAGGKSTTINLQADVHCNNESNGSSEINLTTIFPSSPTPPPDATSDQVIEVVDAGGETDDKKVETNVSSIAPKWSSNKSLVDVPKDRTNSLANNSIGVLETLDFAASSSSNNNNAGSSTTFLSTFRRARSELEAIKGSDKSPKMTPDVPPSHPVSMETITNNDTLSGQQEATASGSGVCGHSLGTCRLNRETNYLNRIGRLSYEPGSSPLSHYPRKMSLKHPKEMKQQQQTTTTEASISVGNLEKIEESQEKSGELQPTLVSSATYLKNDWSEDGDESDVSLFNEPNANTPTTPSTSTKLKPSSRKMYRNSKPRAPQPPSSSTQLSAVRKKKSRSHQSSSQRPRATSTGELGEIQKANKPKAHKDDPAEQEESTEASPFMPQDISSSSDSSVSIPLVSSSESTYESMVKICDERRKAKLPRRPPPPPPPPPKEPRPGYGIADTERYDWWNMTYTSPEYLALTPPPHLSAKRMRMRAAALREIRTGRPSRQFRRVPAPDYWDQGSSSSGRRRVRTSAGAPTTLMARNNEMAFRNALAAAAAASTLSAPSTSASTSKIDPSLILADLVTATPGKHVATGHEDTSAGSTHLFQDERGNWLTYTFDEKSTGVAKTLAVYNPLYGCAPPGQTQPKQQQPPPPSCVDLAESGLPSEPTREQAQRSRSGSTYVKRLPTATTSRDASSYLRSLDIDEPTLWNDSWNLWHDVGRLSSSYRNADDYFTREFIQSLNDNLSFDSPGPSPSFLRHRPNFRHQIARSMVPYRRRRAHYYEINLCNVKQVRIGFDRLALLAFLDRNLSTFELILAILLSIAVSIFSAVLLHQRLFTELSLGLFCLVVASSQYTLLKSVQPDAASPTHGFNRITIYGRPVYFCLVSTLILISNAYVEHYDHWHISFEIYGVDLFARSVAEAIFGLSRLFLLLFPVWFTIGLMPQINTFVIYICEQIDIHLFGGTASTIGMISAVYSVARSILLVSILYFVALALNIAGESGSPKASFSVFCGCLMAASYYLSRMPSDPSLHWQALLALFQTVRQGFRRLWLLITSGRAELPTTTTTTTTPTAATTTTTTPSATTTTTAPSAITTTPPAPTTTTTAAPPAAAVTTSNNSEQQQEGNEAQVNQSSTGITVNVSNENPAGQESIEGERKNHGPVDPLPDKLRSLTLARIESDFLIGIFIAIIVFAVHVSSIFRLQPLVNTGITVLASMWGGLLHYGLQQARQQHPWLCFANPLCQSNEYKTFEVREPAKVMRFEKFQAWWWMLEKNVIFPLVFLSYITTDTTPLIATYGEHVGVLLLVVTAMKSFRATFNDPSHNYIILVFTYLTFNYDLRHLPGFKNNIFLLNYFITAIIYHKVIDFILKFRFVITYVAPWQITWGSAFHAFAQPFSVPHSAMLFVQLIVSSVLSSPLQPIFGSAIFFTSYVRPIKFWERDYNTKRVDHSNTRLASQVDKAQTIGSDDNNLNSIFYEHLTRSLQHSLYGDIVLGRWGVVNQGDCFVLASDNLNCLVHIIELGNGLVTFQVRGLEFRGTYCQQREVEAITESISDDEGCCCCEPGHLRGMLSLNAAFNQRWLSWEIAQTNYVLEGYSISENSATAILTPYDLRKALITYYVKSIIYYCITCKSLGTSWLDCRELADSLAYLDDKTFIDLDPTFNFNIDEDYDVMSSGITRASFRAIYGEWIVYCIEQASLDPVYYVRLKENEEFLVNLCFGLSLLARRALGNASHTTTTSALGVEYFLNGFHSLFKGDMRIHSQRDEWVFLDMDFLNKVIAPSVRMALKLHQEQFASYDEFENNGNLYSAIDTFHRTMIISHEADPAWRNAILSNVPSLLSLRHVLDEGLDHYKVIMLNKKFLNFRVIKINRECVRGLWAGQQQELIFLRNRNQERGSIQNAKQVLRNIINSSCDQPIGYPIYVSPLTTSFAESNAQLSQVIGPPISFAMFKHAILGFFQKISTRCSEVCSSGGSGGVANDLSYAGPRMPNILKSESADRDDSMRGTLMSTHQQMTNYSLYLKKRARQESNKSSLGPMDEEQAIPLVTLHGSRANVRARANSMSASEGNSAAAPGTSAASAGVAAGGTPLESNKSSGSGLGGGGGVAETSFMPMQVLVVDPPLPSPKESSAVAGGATDIV